MEPRNLKRSFEMEIDNAKVLVIELPYVPRQIDLNDIQGGTSLLQKQSFLNTLPYSPQPTRHKKSTLKVPYDIIEQEGEPWIVYKGAKQNKAVGFGNFAKVKIIEFQGKYYILKLQTQNIENAEFESSILKTLGLSPKNSPTFARKKKVDPAKFAVAKNNYDEKLNLLKSLDAQREKLLVTIDQYEALETKVENIFEQIMDLQNQTTDVAQVERAQLDDEYARANQSLAALAEYYKKAYAALNKLDDIYVDANRELKKAQREFLALGGSEANKQSYKEEIVQYHTVMEYLEGKTLEELLQAEKEGNLVIPLLARFGIAIKFLENLCELDEKNILQRDLKPDNIMVDLINQVAKIFDFGFAVVKDANGEYVTDKPKGGALSLAPELRTQVLRFMQTEDDSAFKFIYNNKTESYAAALVLAELFDKLQVPEEFLQEDMDTWHLLVDLIKPMDTQNMQEDTATLQWLDSELDNIIKSMSANEQKVRFTPQQGLAAFKALYAKFFEKQPLVPKVLLFDCHAIAAIDDLSVLHAWIAAQQNNAYEVWLVDSGNRWDAKDYLLFKRTLEEAGLMVGNQVFKGNIECLEKAATTYLQDRPIPAVCQLQLAPQVTARQTKIMR